MIKSRETNRKSLNTIPVTGRPVDVLGRPLFFPICDESKAVAVRNDVPIRGAVANVKISKSFPSEQESKKKEYIFYSKKKRTK